LACVPSHAGTWDHPRGDAANTGFIDVTTAPATAPVQTVPNLGIFAPGAGPVIGTDGTAYVGNFHGEVRAIRSDGSQAWRRTLLRGQAIIASPVIGADGSIYVVGTAWPLIRDHVGGGKFRRYDTTLYRFSSTGAMQWSTNFPEATPGSSGSGAAPAAPNIWRSGETEVIIVPARFDTEAGRDVHLTAFSSDGALLFDHFVTRRPYSGLTAGDSCWLCPDFTKLPNPLREAMLQLGPLRPAVAMVARAGAPEVVVADNYQYIVGYTFSPATGFQETFRKHITNDARGVLMSSPVVLRDGHSVLSGWTQDETGLVQQGWLLFAGPHPTDWSEIVLSDTKTLIPTLTADGRILTVAKTGVTAWRTYPRIEGALVASMRLVDIPAAPATSSRTHVFISLGNALLTFDPNTFQRVGHFGWQDGGGSSPAIGADGRVYAMAGETLYIFPAPPCRLLHACPGEVTVPGGNVVFHPQNPFSNQVTSPVFHTTPSWSGGALSQPGMAPK
jgi:outer membrane protein assembly factor BamB